MLGHLKMTFTNNDSDCASPGAATWIGSVRNLSVSRRIAAALALFLHLAVVGAGPVAHAWSEGGRSPDRVPHIEAQGDGACEPRHNEQFCLICHSFQSRHLAVGATPLPLVATNHHELFRSDPVALSAAVYYSPLGPRAPPLA